MIKLFLFCFLVVSKFALAKDTPFFTGDIGGGMGTNNGTKYTETHLSLNFNFTDWLTFRSSAFQRTGDKIEMVSGLDNSLRLVARSKIGSNGSFNFFIGPGHRWSSKSENSATFAEAGLGVYVGPAGLSAGAKYLSYDKARTNSQGDELSKSEMTYFASVTGKLDFGK